MSATCEYLFLFVTPQYHIGTHGLLTDSFFLKKDGRCDTGEGRENEVNEVFEKAKERTL